MELPQPEGASVAEYLSLCSQLTVTMIRDPLADVVAQETMILRHAEEQLKLYGTPTS